MLDKIMLRWLFRNMGKMTIWAFCLLLQIVFVLPAVASAAPFGPGEKLEYDIYWTFIRAGSATLEVAAPTDVNGTQAMRFVASARSTPAIDKIYKVRDSIESFTDMDVTRSIRYDKKQREGTYSKDVVLDFDWESGVSKRYVRGELRHELAQPGPTFDPLSILFSFRKQVLYKTMRFAAPVSDGKVRVMGEAYVEGTEDIETDLGVIPCFRVRIDVKHLSGVFRKSDDAELLVWFSADERRLPVRVKSKVVVGHFTMRLVGYTPPK